MKLLLICVLLIHATAAFSQTDSLHLRTHEYHVNKIRYEKTGAWVLTGAGATGLLVTFIIDAGNAIGGALITIVSLGTVKPEHHSYTVPYLVSAACIGGGIALFLAASKSRNKAYALSTCLKMEEIPVLHTMTITRRPYPCVVVKIKLP